MLAEGKECGDCDGGGRPEGLQELFLGSVGCVVVFVNVVSSGMFPKLGGALPRRPKQPGHGQRSCGLHVLQGSFLEGCVELWCEG